MQHQEITMPISSHDDATKYYQSPAIRYQKALWAILAIAISFVSFIGAMMMFYYYDILTPWGLLFIVPFTLIIMPWMVLKILPWLSRTITGDRSEFDLRTFAEPQQKVDIDKGNTPRE
jgi:hypothetical protein